MSGIRKAQGHGLTIEGGSMSKQLSRLIDKVSVLGFDIEVEFVESLIEDGEKCHGVYYPHREKIRLLHGDKIDHRKQVATLLHEIFEVIVNKLELNTKHKDITAFESALYTLYLHNPNIDKAFKPLRDNSADKK